MPNPPKPTALKKREGTWRADRALEHEVNPPKGVGVVPGHLTPLARETFVALAHEFNLVLTQMDSKSLELLCETYADYRDLQQQIQQQGHTFIVHTDAGEVIRANPLVKMRDTARQHILALLREFGATPSSRTRVGGEGSDQETDISDFLAKGFQH